MAKDFKLATGLVTASHAYLYTKNCYVAMLMHCQFALQYINSPVAVFAWSFAGLYGYVAAYIINAHSYSGCKLSVLHGEYFWQGGPILVDKTSPPGHYSYALSISFIYTI